MQTNTKPEQAIPIPQEVLNTMGRLLFLAVVKHKEAENQQIKSTEKTA